MWMPERPSSTECSPWNLIWVRTLGLPPTSKTLDKSYELYKSVSSSIKWDNNYTYFLELFEKQK